MEDTQVFVRADESHPGVVDVRLDSGLGQYSHKTQAELEKQYGPLKVVSLTEAAEAEERAACSGPKLITKDDFENALDALPPMRWIRGGRTESFRLCEAISGRIYSAYVRVGQSYYHLAQPISVPHATLIDMVREAFPTTH